MRFFKRRALGGEVGRGGATGQKFKLHPGAHLTGDEVKRLQEAGMSPSEIHDALMYLATATATGERDG